MGGGRQARDRPRSASRSGDEEEGQLDAAAVEEQLEGLKWHLWHGHAYRALQLTEDPEWDLDSGVDRTGRVKKLLPAVSEFHHDIEVNRAFVPTSGDRYRHGEAISTAFVESTVNQVISKRLVKKQQRRWIQREAHLLWRIYPDSPRLLTGLTDLSDMPFPLSQRGEGILVLEPEEDARPWQGPISRRSATRR